jgi:rhodanese-related sulfurtransferase
VPGARHVELSSLAAAVIEPGPVTVMCGHGERAMTGASILAAAGHADVAVFDRGPDSWAAATGRTLTTGTLAGRTLTGRSLATGP